MSSKHDLFSCFYFNTSCSSGNPDSLWCHRNCDITKNQFWKYTENVFFLIITFSVRFRQFLIPLAASTTENEKSERPRLLNCSEKQPRDKIKTRWRGFKGLIRLHPWDLKDESRCVPRQIYAGMSGWRRNRLRVCGVCARASKLTDSSKLQTSGVFQSLRGGGGRRAGMGWSLKTHWTSARLTKPSAGPLKHGIPLWGCGG